LNTAPVEAPAAARPQPSAPVVEEVRVEVEEPKPAAPRVVSMPLPENEEDFRPPAPASGPLDVATMWPRFIEALAQERSNLATFLGLAAVAAGGDGAVDVRFPPQFGFQFNEVTKKGNRETIEKVLRQSFGREVDLHITVEQEKKHDGKDTASEIRPVIPATSLDDEMENEPIIQRIIDTFDGKVL
jgi:hypothetical protein